MGASEEAPASAPGPRMPTLNRKPAQVMHTAAAMSTHTHESAADVLDTRASTWRTVNGRSPLQYASSRRRTRSPKRHATERITSSVAPNAGESTPPMRA